MDSKEHPVVQHGIKAADIISHVSAFLVKFMVAIFKLYFVR